MIRSSNSFNAARETFGKALLRHAVFLGLFVILCLGLTHSASAQVIFAGDEGGFTLAVGATGSAYQVQYGDQKLIGGAAVVDVDTRRRYGAEFEGRWLLFNNPTQIQDKTWLAGPRFHFSRGKFQYYAKGLVGIGQFKFPYDYAQGNYLVVAPGGGVDYRWKRRISFRLADVEYQYWPQFTYGAMTSVGVSAGVRYHIF